jgi:hypothetical protein
MSIFKKHNIYVYDLDVIFKQTNRMVMEYLTNMGLPLDFDFTNKDNQKIYTHYFLVILCDFIISNPHNRKMIFYSNMFTKDTFRKNLIQKIKKIFGIKIWESIWSHSEFLFLLDEKHVNLYDEFELFVESETKPKTFKHIKKYLEKEGFKALSDTYFKDIANKMVVCG